MAFKTTHVGSLPRSKEVSEFLFAKERGEEFEQAEFDRAMANACSETVRLQVEAGIDIVSDGETSKISYATYVKDRYTGFAGDTPRSPPADLMQFPGFMARLAKAGGTPQFSRPKCVGEIKRKPGNELEKDIENLKSGMAAHGASEGFMNAASPGVISLFLPNDYWPNREAYIGALAEAMRDEYRLIVDSGLLLQIDCPDLGLSRHVMFTDLSDDEFVSVAEANVEALNAALEGIDPERVRVHICWGNYEGPHVCDISMDKVLSTLMKVRAKYVLFESSNPRHSHEWTVFEERRSEIPDDKVLIPGVIDTTTNFVEHPELVAQRIKRFARIAGPDRIIAGTDCGFGTFAGFGAVEPGIAYAKLESLAEGARLAS